MRVGITGHQRLETPENWIWVEGALKNTLATTTHEGDIALSSLAIGADQCFAAVALACGLYLDVVIPCQKYEDTFSDPGDLARYHQLLERARVTTVLNFAAPSEDAFLAAGRYIVEGVDLMIAIWNGRPAAGKGGTADVVSYARELRRPVLHLNPETFSVKRRD